MWRFFMILRCFLAVSAVSVSLSAAGFRIEEVAVDSGSRIELRFRADPASYYRVLHGETTEAIDAPVAAGLTGPLGVRAVGSSGFYRVQEIPRSAAFDTDGDSRSDVEELMAGTDPLVFDEVPAKVTTLRSSPGDGESDVGVTRETVLRFSRPLALTTTLTTAEVQASFGGRRLLTRAELAGDRRSATVFYLEPLPGSARIVVTFDGDAVFDEEGVAVDGDGDGEPGGRAHITFDTVNLAPVGMTGVIGRVFASELVDGQAVNLPLEGVTITVDGAEEALRAVTDASGNFRLQPSPAGTFFVHVDGRTAKGSEWPAGAYYPFVGKAWEAEAGKVDNLAGGTGEIYLPLVRAGTLTPVSAIAETRIEFPAEILTSNPQLAGVHLVIPPNALFADDGRRGGRIGIAPVSPDRLPEPLPEGLDFPLVITVQTDGAMNFDQPVPVTFPNLPDPQTGVRLPPGAKTALWSFDHDLGSWVINGPMTVTSDGLFVVCDTGTGIREPGWHGVQPGTSVEGGEIEAECEPTGCVMGPVLIRRLGGGRFGFELEPEARTPGIVNWFAGTASNAQALAGNQVEFTFCEPGSHSIIAQVSPKCGDPCSKSVTITVSEDEIGTECEVGAALIPETVAAGTPLTLPLVFAMGEPAEEELSWEVTGGEPQSGTGTILRTTFCSPGLQTIRWTRTPPCGSPCSQTMSVEVMPSSQTPLGPVELHPASAPDPEALFMFQVAVGVMGELTWSVDPPATGLTGRSPLPGDPLPSDYVAMGRLCEPGTYTVTATLETPCGDVYRQQLTVTSPGAGCLLEPLVAGIPGSPVRVGGSQVLIATAREIGMLTWEVPAGVQLPVGEQLERRMLPGGDDVGLTATATLGVILCRPGTFEIRAHLDTECGRRCTEVIQIEVVDAPCDLAPITVTGPIFQDGAAVYVAETASEVVGTAEWRVTDGELRRPAIQEVTPLGQPKQVLAFRTSGVHEVQVAFTDECDRTCRQTVEITVPSIPSGGGGSLASILDGPEETAPMSLGDQLRQLAGLPPREATPSWSQPDLFGVDVNPTGTGGGADARPVALQGPPPPSLIRQTGLHYYVIVDRVSGAVVRRGIAGRNGVAHARPLILGAHRSLRETIVQADSLWLASQVYRTGDNGSALALARFRLQPPEGPDADGDGVPDEVEELLGLDGTKPDSDGDGITDAEEVRAGTALSDSLGVIAAVSTPGYAIDVATDGDHVAVAVREGAVVLFNIYSGLTPALVAQVGLPGRATAIALAGDTAVVGLGEAGAALVDVAEPTAAFVRQQLRYSSAVKSVAARSGTGLVGLDSGDVVMVDLVTGMESARVSLSRPVHDLALAGNFLYVLTDRQLAAFDLSGGGLAFRGSVAAEGKGGAGQRRFRLFAGGNRAYAVETSGFRVFDLSQPDLPVLLVQRETGQFGWKQLVADGTGHALAAVDANSTDDGLHDVSRYDLGPEGTADTFEEAFPTPGIAEAVGLAGGLGYVADGASGLQVVRVQRRDTFGRSPTVSVRSPFAAGLADENQPATFLADAADDVQIGRVEFLVDDRVVGVDTSFPYEFRVTTPARSDTRTSFRIRARAVDTGGNSALSAELALELVGDATPPGVTRVSPGTFAVSDNGPVDRVSLTLTEAVRPETLTREQFDVRHSGPDGQFDTADDLVIGEGRFSYRPDTLTALLVFDRLLPRGQVQARLLPGVTDLRGNARAEPFTWQFTVGGPRVVSTRPANSSVSSGQQIEARFNGPIDPATLTQRFTVTAPGPDGQIGSADDVPVSGGTLSYDAESFAARLEFEPKLFPGTYRAELGAGVADAAGNALGFPFRWSFTVVNTELEPERPVMVTLNLGAAGSESDLAVTLPTGVWISVFAPVVFGDCVVWSLVDPAGRPVFTDQVICRRPAIFQSLLAGDYLLRGRATSGSGSQHRVTMAVATQRSFEIGSLGQDRLDRTSGARVPGDVDTWEITLPAGESFVFTAAGSGEVFGTLTDLVGGTRFENEALLNRFVTVDSGLGGRFRFTAVAATAGGYQFSVIRNKTRQFAVDLRGEREFSSASLPGVGDVPRVPGDVDLVRFTLGQGERWAFVPTSFFPCFEWSLLDLVGAEVIPAQSYCLGHVEVDSGLGGDFTLRLEARERTGQYSFNAVKAVQQAFAHDLRGGQLLDVVGRLAGPGSRDTYRLELDPGVQVRFVVGGTCVLWEWRAPEGGVSLPATSSCDGPIFVVPAAGGYELDVVHPGQGAALDYELHIRPMTGLRVNEDLRTPGARFEQTVEPISAEPPEDRFHFTVAGGVGYRVRIEGRVPVQFRVYDADEHVAHEIEATVRWQEFFTPSGEETLRLGLQALGEDQYTLFVEPVPQAAGRWTGGDMNTPLDQVEAGIIHQGALHLAGRRYRPGEVDEVFLIRQDGAQWTTVGSFEAYGFFRGVIETNSPHVLALVSDGTSLFVGGRYTTVNGVHAPLVARWDGAVWHPLTDPAFGGHVPQALDTVHSLALFRGQLIAGGDFLQLAGPSLTRYAARWDGATWQPLGGGLSGGFRGFNGQIFGMVATMAERDGRLYLAGTFTEPSGGVAAWDGTNIVAVPGLIDRSSGGSPSVSELLVTPAGLHAAGSFTIVQDGQDVAANLGLWDGAAWMAVSGFPSGYGAQGVADSEGAFYLTGDVPLGAQSPSALSNGLYRWQASKATGLHNGVLREYEQPFFGGGGSSARSARGGLLGFTPGDVLPFRESGLVQTVFAHDGRFYVLGMFDLAGPVRVRNWAVWEPEP